MRARHAKVDLTAGSGLLRLLPPHDSNSTSRDIDTRESWGDASKESSSVRRSHGLKLENPDVHEPSANFITVVASLVMFAVAVWWGSVQFHHATLPEEPAVSAGGGSPSHAGSNSAGDAAPARP